MKARVIETGEIIHNPIKPKMVSLDKVCEWIKANANKYIYFDEGNTEWHDDDECIADLRREFE